MNPQFSIAPAGKSGMAAMSSLTIGKSIPKYDSKNSVATGAAILAYLSSSVN